MPNQKISQLTPKGSALAGTDLLEVSVFNGVTYDTKSLTGANVVSGLQPTLVSGTNIKTINSTSLLGSGNIVISTGLTVGTTAIASGTIGRILFEGTGNVLQQDSTLFWDNTNKRLGVGATPSTSVRLDVRSQGALSTDIALRVRNSANNNNLFTVSGNNTIKLLSDPASVNGIAISAGAFASPLMTFSDQFAENIRINADGSVIRANNFRMGSETGNSFGGLITTPSLPAQGRFFRIIDQFANQWLNIGGSSYDGTGMELRMRASTNNNSNYILFQGFSNTNQVVISDNACIGIGGTSYGTSAKYVIAQYTGVAPTTSPADSFQQYSADIVAGNAAPHFKTENGAVVKLYQETTAVASATVVSGAGGNVKHDDKFDGYTVEQVVKALRNQGLLA